LSSFRVAALAALAALFVFAAAPVSAQFVNQTAVPGEASAIAAGRGLIYVARSNIPSVLAFDPVTSTLVAEISLLTVSDSDATPAGATAMTTASDGSIIVGTKPYGVLYRIVGITAARMGAPPVLPNRDTIGVISALHAHSDGRLYVGGLPHADTSSAVVFRYASHTALGGPTRFDLPGESIVNAIGGMGRSVGFGTRDTFVVGARGRLYLYDTATEAVTLAFIGDSSVTVVAPGADTLLFATSPSGSIRSLAAGLLAAVPETVVRALLFARDGPDSSIFIGSETNVFRRIRNGVLESVGVPVPAASTIAGLVFNATPERVYGIARNAAGSFLFFYDTVPPTLVSVNFSIDTPLRQPSTSDTFIPPLTRGRYFVRFHTSERLRAVPTIRVVYADGAVQTLTVTGSELDYSAELVIDSTRVLGTVTIIFIGVDDAGNTGTVILSGGTFENRGIGQVAIANNRIRPGMGEFMTVRYFLLSPQTVSIKVYNMRGQPVADISPGFHGPGEYQDAVWGGRNTRGALVASGVYLIRVEAGNEFRTTHKVMVIR
jgi:hypothetical protein